MSKNIFFAVMFFVLLSLFSCRNGQLTGEEQKSFKGCIGIKGITQEDALNYLRVLVKGDPGTIRWYAEYEKAEDRMAFEDRNSLYQEDVCSMVRVLSRNKNIADAVSGNRRVVRILSEEESREVEEGYKLVMRVIKQKAGYPKARACAVEAVKLYGELKDGEWHGDKRSIPVLKEAVNDKDPEVRLQAAAALLSLGEGDIALPVLDGLAGAGIPRSIIALDKLFAPEERRVNGKRRIVLSETRLFDERGRDILVKALNYSGDEIRAFAALRLAGMGVEKELVENTAIEILERLKDKKKKDYKKLREWQRAIRAGYNAVSALEKIKSAKGLDVLNALVEHSEEPVIQKKAESALENIRRYSLQSTTR